jgi:indolepyruvate decarboxylase
MAVMTPQNVVPETERLIAAALYHRRPVYMTFPKDYVNQKALGSSAPAPVPQSDPESLIAATDAILAALAKATTAGVLPGILIVRAGLQAAMQEVIDASGLPFATMFMDKSVLEEQQPNYIGMYDGRLMNEDVRTFVEGCDCILEVGTLLTDLNTGAFTSKLDLAKTISISHHRTQVGGKTYSSVEMGDVLKALAKRLPKRARGTWPQVCSLGAVVGEGADSITDSVVLDRVGDARRARCSRSRARSKGSAGNRRGFAPNDRAGSEPVRALSIEARDLRAEQFRLSDRTPALQESGDRI